MAVAQFVSDFNVDLVRDKPHIRYGGPICFQGDANSQVLTIHLYKDGEEYSGGGTVSGTAIRTKTGATVPLTGTIAGNTVTVPLIANCFLAPGAPLNVFVALSDSTITTTILAVVYDVVSTTTSNVVDPSGETTLSVATLTSAIASAVATIPADYSDLMASIAPTYADLEFPIDAGMQLCWYDGQLYVNTVDIASSETWDSTHWQATDVSGEIAELYFKHFPPTGQFVAGSGSVSASYATAVGNDTVSSGWGSHAEGYGTTASGTGSHAEGKALTAGNLLLKRTTATGAGSHAEGVGTTASENGAHAEGIETEALGTYSHAEGQRTIAAFQSQHVFGEYNIQDDGADYSVVRGTYVEIVGNGTATNARSNARTLDWSGNETLAGDLTLNNGGADEVTVGEKLNSLNVATVSETTTYLGIT